jgi:CheY-like chemotaxis protein
MSFRISTVLVVDDNPIARATAVHLIQDLGLKVVDAYDGATALVLLKLIRRSIFFSLTCVCPA